MWVPLGQPPTRPRGDVNRAGLLKSPQPPVETGPARPRRNLSPEGRSGPHGGTRMGTRAPATPPPVPAAAARRRPAPGGGL